MLQSILLLFAHWIGDYAFQTNEMANYKGQSLKWLSIHVAVYSVPILVTGVILFPISQALGFLITNTILHWITDFLTSKMAYRFRENPRLFYPIIGFDQFIHAACLLGTAQIFNTGVNS